MNRKETLDKQPPLSASICSNERNQKPIFSQEYPGGPLVISAFNCLSISSRVPLKHRCEEKTHNPVSTTLLRAPELVEAPDGSAAQLTSQCSRAPGVVLASLCGVCTSELAVTRSQHSSQFPWRSWSFLSTLQPCKSLCHSLTQAVCVIQSSYSRAFSLCFRVTAECTCNPCQLKKCPEK